jgi:hypothetical protein
MNHEWCSSNRIDSIEADPLKKRVLRSVLECVGLKLDQCILTDASQFSDFVYEVPRFNGIDYEMNRYAVNLEIFRMMVGKLSMVFDIVPERGAYTTVVDYVEAVCGKS